jgi:hypothetical protein
MYGGGDFRSIMTTYQQIRQQVENLTPDEQILLLGELASMVGRHIRPNPKRSIMDLEGLGKEIWQGVDAQVYVDRERASWNG